MAQAAVAALSDPPDYAALCASLTAVVAVFLPQLPRAKVYLIIQTAMIRRGWLKIPAEEMLAGPGRGCEPPTGPSMPPGVDRGTPMTMINDCGEGPK